MHRLGLNNANYGVPEFLQRIKELTARDGELLGYALQRSVSYIAVDQKITHGITRIDLLSRTDNLPEPETTEYPTLILRREIYEIPELLNRLSSFEKKEFMSGDQIFGSTYHCGFYDRYLPSNNEYREWPGILFDISFNAGQSQIPIEPLSFPKLKFYKSPARAIKEFLELRQFNDSDGRFGHILFYFPNFNARLRQLVLRNRKLHVQLESAVPLNSLELQVAYSRDGRDESKTIIPEKNTSNIELAFMPREIDIRLISAAGYPIDYFQQDEYGWFGCNSVLAISKREEAPSFHFGETPMDSIEVISGKSSRVSLNKKKRIGAKPKKGVFIIHGHNKGIRESLARFVQNLGLKPVVLDEKSNKGRTIIEKFEYHATTVGFAVALLTADDEGKGKNEVNHKPRPRQNVLFEFGFFIGKLGRERVCGLKEREVEVPSDYSGVLYIPLDEEDLWKIRLAKELKSAGYAVNLDKALLA